MRRRDFLLGLSGTAAGWRYAYAEKLLASEGWRTFEITTSTDIAKPAGRTCLWLPLVMSRPTAYQRTLETNWNAPGASRAEVVKIPGYEVELLRVEWPDSKAVSRVTLVHRVATRDRKADVTVSPSARVAHEAASTLHYCLRPTKLLPTDGIVKSTAERITRGSHGEVEKARALYEWVVENTNRDPKVRGCGLGDVASMLKSGMLSGKCADINALFVALARSVQIPARDVYGLRVTDSRLGFKSLGKSGDVSKAQHCRAEFYSKEYGWIPVDPADVRKLVLEESPGNLRMSDPKVQKARGLLFGSWEMNWVAYNYGHDIALPGSDKQAIPFLMYPVGETAEARLDSLDPATFEYEIYSREVAEGSRSRTYQEAADAPFWV
jgi:transglutaminase-like putative cysteine protease